MKKLQLRGLARSLSRISVLAAVACAAFATQQLSAQIVDNGNFQQNASSFSGYAGYANNSGNFAASPTSIPGFSGQGSYGIEGYNEPASHPFYPAGFSSSATSDPVDFTFLQNTGTALTQTVVLNQLTNYTVTFLSADRQGNPDATGTVSVQVGALTFALSTTDPAISTNNPPVNGFTSYSFSFYTGLNQTSALLTLANTTTATVNTADGSDETVEFSDVVITEGARNGFVPEPSTYALLGLGALGLMLASRRKTLKA